MYSCNSVQIFEKPPEKVQKRFKNEDFLDLEESTVQSEEDSVLLCLNNVRDTHQHKVNRVMTHAKNKKIKINKRVSYDEPDIDMGDNDSDDGFASQQTSA